MVQFQHRRGTGEWKDTIETLQRYTGQVPGSTHREQQRPVRPTPPADQSAPTREQAVVRSFDLKPLTDDTYLRSRGLSPATVNAPEFEHTVFNRTYFDRNRGKQYVNTVFPVKK